MRTFQYSDARSHKFWTIDVQGNTFTVTYGKVGTAGQSQTKTFPTPEKAAAEAEKLIREKTGKGYTETTPLATAPADEGAALEKAVVANPRDLAAWNALADLLIERGDPRGEFMRVQLALENEKLGMKERDALRKKEAALLRAHEREWMGALAAFARDAEPQQDWRTKTKRRPVEVTFERGWLSGVTCSRLTVAQARALRDPAARLLRRLAVEECEPEAPVGPRPNYIDHFYEPGPDVPADLDPYDDPGLHALCRCPHLGSVRVFQLGEPVTTPDGKEEEYFNCHTSGRLAYHLVKQMPQIEELYLHAHNVDGKKLFALPMPELRVLQVFHSKDYALDKLAANPSLTNLTRLICYPHAVDVGDDPMEPYIRLRHLTALCRSKNLPALTHLRLNMTDFGDKGVKEMIASGLLKRLKVLDLDHGCVTDEGAEMLAACPDLKNLEFLRLSANALTDAGIARLKKTGVKLDAARQHGEAPPFGEDELPEYLFEGDIE